MRWPLAASLCFYLLGFSPFPWTKYSGNKLLCIVAKLRKKLCWPCWRPSKSMHQPVLMWSQTLIAVCDCRLYFLNPVLQMWSSVFAPTTRPLKISRLLGCFLWQRSDLKDRHNLQEGFSIKPRNYSYLLRVCIIELLCSEQWKQTWSRLADCCTGGLSCWSAASASSTSCRSSLCLKYILMIIHKASSGSGGRGPFMGFLETSFFGILLSALSWSPCLTSFHRRQPGYIMERRFIEASSLEAFFLFGKFTRHSLQQDRTSGVRRQNL